MDGVFVNTEPIVFSVFRRVFAPLNIPLTDEYQYKFVGHPFDKNMDDIRNDFGVDIRTEEIRRRFNEIYKQVFTNARIDAQPGFWRIIDLARQRKMPTALCTTSSRHHVDVVFAKIGERAPLAPETAFQAVVTGDDVTHKKPHPEPYLTAAGKIAAAPENCLVIEDSLSGIRSARAAGCFCIALRQPYNERLDLSMANAVVDNLGEALLVIKDQLLHELDH